jgi:hypothetical protein
MHVTDWLPTLAGAAGIKIDTSLGRPCPAGQGCNRTIAPLDGVDNWAMLSRGNGSARVEALLDLQATSQNKVSIDSRLRTITDYY